MCDLGPFSTSDCVKSYQVGLGEFFFFSGRLSLSPPSNWMHVNSVRGSIYYLEELTAATSFPFNYSVVSNIIYLFIFKQEFHARVCVSEGRFIVFPHSTTVFDSSGPFLQERLESTVRCHASSSCYPQEGFLFSQLCSCSYCCYSCFSVWFKQLSLAPVVVDVVGGGAGSEKDVRKTPTQTFFTYVPFFPDYFF